MTATAPLDPRTPVVVGVGQSSERLDQDGYRGLSPIDLAVEAGRGALADTGADAQAMARAVDTLATTRQFENSVPGAAAPLGRSTGFPRSVAARLGIDPRRAVLEVAGGQSPQHLVNELAAALASGDAEVVLLAGSEAISTVRHLAKSDPRPDFSDDPEGEVDDRGFGLKGLTTREQVMHGLVDAPSQYGLLENARRAARGSTREEYAAEMGALFAPFTQVAAANPHAASPTVRTAEELVTVDESNRMIADPYPRLLVARDQVNQGAAVVLTTVGAAQRLGIAPDRWVFLHGHADLRERELMARPDLGASPAAGRAIEHALEVAGATLDDVRWIDLYSCFPIAVSAVCDGLGLAPDDPRGLTLTGGLPYFGGAGNNYSMHAIAEAVDRVRSAPGTTALVGANGGVLSKYSVGVYGTEPRAWVADRSERVQAALDAVPVVPETRTPDGWATIETFTVKHGRDARTGLVIGRLEADGHRFLASVHDGDDETLALLEQEQPVGARVFVRSFGFGNRVAVDEDRMAQLFPPRAPGFRESYEHVLVRRDGHLLEVTLNRPDARNALHGPAHDELEEIFDAYEADPELWVAIITGAGEKSFCAGNDLLASLGGGAMSFPPSGFAGLTSRALTKPVIAAVNGYAMGGGFEIALACHLVVADETARFALSEVKVGLAAAAGGLVRLPRVIPAKVANELILTGRRIDAEEARGLGVVNRVVPAGTALEGARELAAQILEGSPTSVRVSLQMMAESRGIADDVEATRHPSTGLDQLLVSADTIEGLTAFLEKRPARWTGR